MARGVGWFRRLRLLLAERRALARLRGHWYRLAYRLRGIELRVGERFHVHGRLRIRGGGRVTIGDLVFIGGELLIEGSGEVVIGDGVTIEQGLYIQGPGTVVLGDHVTVLARSSFHTQNRVARIAVGERTMMRGPYFNCVREIVVGRECMLAKSTILDTDFHSTRADRRSLDSPVRVAPVYLGDNVWVAERAALLAGTRVGTNSVVGYGAICMREFPENVIILGNPARVSAPIPSIAGGGGGEEGAGGGHEHLIPLRELTRREIPW